MNELMSEQLREAILIQVGHEKFNANLYQFIGAFLKNKGFDNLAKIFEHQWEEEEHHAKMLIDLLTDLDVDVTIPNIPESNVPFMNIGQIAQFYFDREFKTTQSLKELRDFAIDDGNSIVEEKIREMISMQQVEMREALDFVHRSGYCGDDWFKVMLWDLAV